MFESTYDGYLSKPELMALLDLASSYSGNITKSKAMPPYVAQARARTPRFLQSPSRPCCTAQHVPKGHVVCPVLLPQRSQQVVAARSIHVPELHTTADAQRQSVGKVGRRAAAARCRQRRTCRRQAQLHPGRRRGPDPVAITRAVVVHANDKDALCEPVGGPTAADDGVPRTQTCAGSLCEPVGGPTAADDGVPRTQTCAGWFAVSCCAAGSTGTKGRPVAPIT